MGNSLRGIQAAMTAGGFGYHKMNAMNAAFPTIVQNFLSTATANVASSVTFVDAVQSGITVPQMGQGLQIELGESGELGFFNWWEIEVHGIIATAATQGVQLRLQTYDGLVLTSSTSISYVFNTATAGIAVNQPVGTGATAGAVNAVSFDIQGIVQVSGYGRLGLQFTQAVSTAANTAISYGKIKATAIIA
jgi:hypothetical protein